MKLRGIDSYPFVQCDICGADIAKKRQEGSKNYLKRKTCRIADKPECAAKYMHMTAIKNLPDPTEKPPRKKKSASHKKTKGTEQPTEHKITPSISEQIELERKKLIASVRILSEQERRELEKVYTPPVRRDNTMPHYQRRSWGDI